MLIRGLGYRSPSLVEEQEILDRLGSRGSVAARQGPIPAAVLHAEPLISYSGIVPHAPLGLASLWGPSSSARRAWFLLSPTWSIETDEAAKDLHEQAVLHRLAHRNHRLVFICNTPEETAIMQKHGEAAFAVPDMWPAYSAGITSPTWSDFAGEFGWWA